MSDTASPPPSMTVAAAPPSPIPTTCVSPVTSNRSTSLPPSPTTINTVTNINDSAGSPTDTTTINDDTNSVGGVATASASGQQFRLRWNNYQANLMKVFWQLLDTESFVDVTLACEEKSLKAHRIVLSSCSSYFDSVLKEADSTHPVIILQGVKWIELKGVIEFMYKGQINVSQENLSGLLKLAEILKIKGLTDTGEGEAETILKESPSKPSIRVGDFASDENPRKRRRISGEDNQFSQNNRSRFSSPNNTPPMALDFLDTSLEPMMSQNNMGRSSSASNHSSNIANGLSNAGSPTASLASSLSSLAAHLPSAMPPPGHPMGSIPHHLSHLPPLSPLSPLLNMHHPAMARHHANPEDFEIRPGIAEMIREEERAKLLESSHHWMGSSMGDTYQAQVQAAWQKSWNQTQSLLQNLRFRERGPLKSWRPETMADAIHAVLKEGLSLSQAARKYDIPYPTFVLYANRVHNLLGPSAEPGDLRPKGRGRPQRILLGSWPEDQIKVVIRAVVFRDTSVFKDTDYKARMDQKHSALSKPAIKQEEIPSTNGHPHPAPLGLPPNHSVKSSPSTRSPTPDSAKMNAGSSHAAASRGPTPQSLAHMSSLGPLAGHMLGHNMLDQSAAARPQISSESSGGQRSQHSPQQSPAVSTPLAPPLSSPATPDTAVPPTSPSLISASSLGANNPTTTTSCTSVPQTSPSAVSPQRRASPSESFRDSGKGQDSGSSSANGASPNSNLMAQHLNFPQHLLQQQMIGGLMQGQLPPNIPPPPNHSRMPHMPPAPFPGYMRHPVPPQGVPRLPEDSPEALLFSKIVGGQFPQMNNRAAFFQPEGGNQTSRNANMMFHREAMESIKNEPEAILN